MLHLHCEQEDSYLAIAEKIKMVSQLKPQEISTVGRIPCPAWAECKIRNERSFKILILAISVKATKEAQN
jgi:hypothetical protein